MRKLIVAGVATAGLLPVAVAGAKSHPAPHPASSANQTCHQLRHDLGVAAFRQAYGTNHNRANAMGKCRSAERRTHHAAHTNAAQTCRDERSSDPAAFTERYGTGKKGANAFGRCVSQHVSDATDEHHDALVNAARTCRSERADDPAAFKDTYGTNRNGRNAFGRCVRQTARHHTA